MAQSVRRRLNSTANPSRYSLYMRYMAWIAALGLAAWILTRLPFTDLLQTITNLEPSQWIAWTGLNLFVIVLLT